MIMCYECFIITIMFWFLTKSKFCVDYRDDSVPDRIISKIYFNFTSHYKINHSKTLIIEILKQISRVHSDIIQWKTVLIA
jgi:hypothetical protein